MPMMRRRSPWGVVDDDLDRGDALGRSLGGRATAAHEPCQLAAEAIVDGLVEAQSHHAPLAPGQADSIVEADGDVHASAQQPSRAIGATQAGALDWALCAGPSREVAVDEERRLAISNGNLHVSPSARQGRRGMLPRALTVLYSYRRI